MMLSAFVAAKAQLKGVPFDQAVSLEEVMDQTPEELYNILVKTEEDDVTKYLYVYEVKGKGYYDALRRLSSILNANNISRPADIEDSYCESHVDENDYNEVAYQLRMELGWIERTWFAYDDSWKIVMMGYDEAIAVGVAHDPNRFEWESQQQTEGSNSISRNAFGNQERIEREAREEQERIERERQAQAERLNNQGRDAFGNQSDPNGSPDADNYGTGGGLGDGVSFGGLGSRRASGSLPKPNMSRCDVTQKIEVTVEVQVDRNGNVTKAMVTKSSYQNKCIWDKVVDAAKKSKFTVDQSANTRQTGWIRYTIVP
jgi:hypothetical protein